MTGTTQQTPVRDAATVILVRDPDSAPTVLMGQRGAKAAFMPSKFVFPGGAVDTGDAGVQLAAPLPPLCASRLSEANGGPAPDTLAAAAIRELWEETGLLLGRPGTWQDPPRDWKGFAATTNRPDASGLAFVFRAITPPGRPRRFDARFFLIDASHVQGDLDDFSRASDELSHLQWIPLSKARSFDLPFITEIVLSEVARRLPLTDAPEIVPFFQNDDEDSRLRALGRSPESAT